MPITGSKSVTINGRRYRLSTRSWDDHIALRGSGINTLLPAGTTLDSRGLRQIVEATIDRYREARREASEMIRDRVRNGTAGLGVACATGLGERVESTPEESPDPIRCPNPACGKPIKATNLCWECPACGWYGDTADIEDIAALARMGSPAGRDDR